MAKIIVNNPKQVINGGAKKYYFKVKGLGGPKGDKGDKGDTGSQGPQGPQGNAATVSIGSTTTLPVGYDATVTNSGSIYNAVLNFGIPQGPRGPQGATGAKGDKGDKGDQGNPGPQGEKGTNATVTVGTTTTTDPGTQAYAWNSSSNPNNAVINFNIPRGATGATGATGPQGPTGPAGADGADGQDGQNFTPTIVETLPTTGDQSKLYLTPKNYTTGTATGNPITISLGEDAGQITSFQLDGDTYQQSYTGKNLLNVEGKWSITAGAGVTVTDGADGSLILNGTVTAREDIRLYSSSDRFTLESGKTVTMSREPYSNWNLIWHRFTSESGTGTSDIKYFDPGASSFTYTTLDTDYGYQFIMRLPVGTTFNNTHVYLQLELGSTASSFEPYVGGVPSPNPDYPQAIQTVTGEQTVEVVGKNLFDKNNANIVRGYIAGTYLNAGTDYTIWIPCEENTDYAIQKMVAEPQSANRFRINCYDQVPAGGVASLGSQYLWNGGDGSDTSNHVYTTPAGAKYLGITVMTQNSGGETTIDDMLASVQIEKSSTITPYTPYNKQTLPISLGSIILCKLGDYQDYIYKSGSDWKVRKATKSITITGAESETWTAQTTTNNYYSYRLTVSDADKIASSYEVALAKSDCFTSGKSSDLNTATSGYYIYQLTVTGYLRFFTGDSTNKLTDFKAMLAQKTPKVVYPLTTPTETTITDTNLIAQLEAVRTASLQASNTITNTATGTNLAGDMEIGYYGYNPTNRYDKFIWLDLNNNYEQIGGE